MTATFNAQAAELGEQWRAVLERRLFPPLNLVSRWLAAGMRAVARLGGGSASRLTP
jgi:hypothetical protein